ncbi:ammonium transporter [Allocoleopsis franciscana]|uniref:ammonium transporter n=1 Tax=Allocoleopsis franciscana TaxID=2886352 RepID=UPI00155B31BA|nr:ammonium transporter [Allocoleopsis franciscana]
MLASVGIAQAPQPSPSAQELLAQQERISTDTTFVTLAAIPVFFMNLGYALWSTVLCGEQPGKAIRQHLMILALSIFAFWALGFGLMFGNGNGFIGVEGVLFLSGADNSPAIGDAYQGAYSSMSWAGIPLNIKFLFLVSNVVVSTSILASTFIQRRNPSIVFIFCLLFVCFIYPITGHWIWGGGWLARMGFWDYAGSTVIFSVSGWAALVGVWVFGSDEEPHSKVEDSGGTQSINILYVGFLILCLGLIALNTGSTIGFGDGRSVNHIAITTIASAIGSAIGAIITCWIYLRRQNTTRIIQGVLSGLVAISASCAFVGTAWAVEIGFIASILTFLFLDYLKKSKISDISGLISIHLVGGIWGTLSVSFFAAGESNASNALYSIGPAVGLFNGGLSNGESFQQLFQQLVGIIAAGTFAALVSWMFCLIIKLSTKSDAIE